VTPLRHGVGSENMTQAAPLQDYACLPYRHVRARRAASFRLELIGKRAQLPAAVCVRCAGRNNGLARRRNYRVIANSRSIKPSTDSDVLAIAGDISDAKTADRIVKEGLAKFGRIDTLGGFYRAKEEFNGVGAVLSYKGCVRVVLSLKCSGRLRRRREKFSCANSLDRVMENLCL
jgi:hypothetical protein